MKDSFLRDLLFFVRKNKIISFSLLAFLVSFIFFAFMSVWIFFQNKTVITYTKSGYSTSGTLPLDIKMEIPFKSEGVKNCWQEGNDAEWEEMKKHTSYGGDILEDFCAVEGIREAALCHHERYDGTGYPRGLRDKEIPIQARIIAVADSYDAMIRLLKKNNGSL